MIILENIIESYKLFSKKEWEKSYVDALNEEVVSKTYIDDTCIFKFFNENIDNIDNINNKNSKYDIKELYLTSGDWMNFLEKKISEDRFLSTCFSINYWTLGKNYIAIPLLMTCVEGIIKNIVSTSSIETNGIENSSLPDIINSPYFSNFVIDYDIRLVFQVLMHKDGGNLWNRTMLSKSSDKDFEEFYFTTFMLLVLKIILDASNINFSTMNHRSKSHLVTPTVLNFH